MRLIITAIVLSAMSCATAQTMDGALDAIGARRMQCYQRNNGECCEYLAQDYEGDLCAVQICRAQGGEWRPAVTQCFTTAPREGPQSGAAQQDEIEI